ncbi:MAG: hypothetical protein HY000_21675 [Planctomycetes bacterium]|nr:hypothetical protein [Planctomycetota bacterium]
MRCKGLVPLFAAAVAAAVVSAALSEELSTTTKPDAVDSGKAGSKEKTRPGRELPAFTSEREAAALTFISLHHPEMAELLRQLKGTSPAEYKREIRVLFRSSESLAELKDKDPELYDLELQAWVLDSRIRLLAARLSMTPSESVEQELRQALSEQIDVRIAQQTLTRSRLAARLAELDTQIERLEANRDEQIQRRVKSLLNGKVPRGKEDAKNRDD